MRWVRNLSIAKKLFGLILVAVVSLLCVGFTGYIYNNMIAWNANDIYQDRVLPMEWLNQVRVDEKTLGSYALEMTLAENDSIKDSLEEKSKKLDEEVNGLIAKYEQVAQDSFEVEKLDEFKKQVTAYSTERAKVYALAMGGENEAAYDAYKQRMEMVGEDMFGQLDALVEYNRLVADRLAEQNHSFAVEAFEITTGLTLLAAVVFVVIGWLIVRIITRPLRMVQEMMSKAEAGDLTVEGTYESKDELGRLTQSFNKMISGLRALISEIHRSSLRLTNSAEELSAGNEMASHATADIATTVQQMASGSENQMHRTEESARAMEEMATGIQRIAETTTEVTEASVKAATEATQGTRFVEGAAQQMQSIYQSVQQSSSIIETLNQRSHDIQQIVGVIRAIAEQTNLLSLNAAIEAARAGEQGRGFAVVADEVRKLAEQSSHSANQITDLLGSIQNDSEHSVDSMRKVTGEVQVGLEEMHRVGEVFQRILNDLEHIADNIQDVAATSEEMAAGSQQISAAVSDMAETARLTAQSSQQAANASHEHNSTTKEIAESTDTLRMMAQDMKALVDRFKYELEK
ncbi:MAG: methyl-accepting chemotaxis protein [Tumebacillaceae bacterium]